MTNPSSSPVQACNFTGFRQCVSHPVVPSTILSWLLVRFGAPMALRDHFVRKGPEAPVLFLIYVFPRQEGNHLEEESASSSRASRPLFRLSKVIWTGCPYSLSAVTENDASTVLIVEAELKYCLLCRYAEIFCTSFIKSINIITSNRSYPYLNCQWNGGEYVMNCMAAT